MRWIASCLCAAVMAASAAPAVALDNETKPDPEVLQQSGEKAGDENATVPEERDAVVYLGLGGSKVHADFKNVSDAYNIDLVGGAHLPVLTWISGEIDFSFTVAPGNNRGLATRSSTGGTPCIVPPGPLNPTGTPPGCDVNAQAIPLPGQTTSANDLQMTNIGAFVALKTPGRLYALGKYGYRYINCSIPEIQHGSDQDGTAYTYGLGYRFGVGLVGLEAAYTHYSSQLEYYGLSLAYGFGASPGPGPH